MMQNRILLHQKRKWLLKFIYIDCCIARYVVVVVVVVVAVKIQICVQKILFDDLTLLFRFQNGSGRVIRKNRNYVINLLSNEGINWFKGPVILLLLLLYV